MIPELIERVARGRVACFNDNEEPVDVLISDSLKERIQHEAEPYMAYMQDGVWDKIMGLRVEWVKSLPEDMSIRTVHGDLRRI